MKKKSASKRYQGQHENETAMDYLRRAVSNLDYEEESILDHFESPEAILDYFELWHTYDTEFWSGICECIEVDGADPAPARAFIKKHGLHSAWLQDIASAVYEHQRRKKEERDASAPEVPN